MIDDRVFKIIVGMLYHYQRHYYLHVRVRVLVRQFLAYFEALQFPTRRNRMPCGGTGEVGAVDHPLRKRPSSAPRFAVANTS